MTSDFRWDLDELTKALISRLQNSNVGVETREFLGPIYKWTKVGSKLYSIAKAFAFTKWMIQLKMNGDPLLNIPVQSSIDPKFAINTIITMSQRANKPNDAQQAYALIKSHNMIPDVFTVTALLDVVGRSSIEGFYLALDIYKTDMIASSDHRCLPNVVTFVTLLRIVGHILPQDANSIIIQLLDDAHDLASQSFDRINCDNHVAPIIHLGGNAETGSVDISIYNAALASCHKIKSFSTAMHIVSMIVKHKSVISTLTRKILAKIVNICFGEDNLQSTSTLLSHIEHYSKSNQAIETAINSSFSMTIPSIINYLSDQFRELPEITADIITKKDSTYAGCLGSDASETLRQSVIEHDAKKLLERLQLQNSPVTESDFSTLIHQCRKRKWSNEIDYLLSFVKTLATNGYPDVNVLPQPHLYPTLHGLYEASIDAYFACGSLDQALILFNEVIERYCDGISTCVPAGPVVSTDASHEDENNAINALDKDDLHQNLIRSSTGDITGFVYFCCRGFASHARADLVLHAYWAIRKRNYMPSRKLILGNKQNETCKLCFAILIGNLCWLFGNVSVRVNALPWSKCKKRFIHSC